MAEFVISENHLKKMAKEAGLLSKALTDEPTFKVDKDIGEDVKTIPKGEKDYRAALLLALAAIFPTIAVIAQSKDSMDVKLTKMDKELASFRGEAAKQAEKTIPTVFEKGVKDANKTLRGIDKTVQTVFGDKARSLIIQEQQVNNITDISNYIRGRIIQGLNINEIKGIYKAESNFDFINSAFNIGQNRLDVTGMFGYIESEKQGYLSSLLEGEMILGPLEADWATVGDNNVCDYCGEKDGETFLISEWPEPHDVPFPDRCWMENVRLEGT